MKILIPIIQVYTFPDRIDHYKIKNLKAQLPVATTGSHMSQNIIHIFDTNTFIVL